ncbi:hypothetical protein JZU48_04265, partial [bacterium]|nr:hypothetical protein [bacterium]
SAADFPSRERWLFADPNRVAVWGERLDELGEGLRVGIAWRSGLVTLNRRGSYAPLSAWGPVLTAPGVLFVNLQHGPCHEESAAAERMFGAPHRPRSRPEGRF